MNCCCDFSLIDCLICGEGDNKNFTSLPNLHITLHIYCYCYEFLL